MNMKMRVMHILSGDVWGGSESQMFTQLSALKKHAEAQIGLSNNSAECLVLLLNDLETSQRYREAGLNLALAKESSGFLNLVRTSLLITKRFAPQIIVTHGYKEAMLGALLSILTGAKLITTYHGALEPQTSFMKRFKARVYAVLHKVISRIFAKRIITVSRALSYELGFANLQKLRVVHNVVSMPDGSISYVNDTTSQHLSVVIVGRLVPVKRIDIAIKAFLRVLEEVPQVKLLIVGDGHLRESLVRLVKDLQIVEHVEFLGFRRDARSIIESADVLLLTSDNEGTPTVILERMAVGKPILSSDLPGVREIVEKVAHYPIYLAPKGDVDAFASMLKLCIKDRDRRYSKEEIRLQFADHFFPQAAIMKHLSIYSELFALCRCHKNLSLYWV